MKIDGSALEEKSSFQMVGLFFSPILDCCSDIVFIDKTFSKKIADLSRSMKFLSPEVASYICKYITQPCMDFNFNVWAGAS